MLTDICSTKWGYKFEKLKIIFTRYLRVKKCISAFSQICSLKWCYYWRVHMSTTVQATTYNLHKDGCMVDYVPCT